MSKTSEQTLVYGDATYGYTLDTGTFSFRDKAWLLNDTDIFVSGFRNSTRYGFVFRVSGTTLTHITSYAIGDGAFPAGENTILFYTTSGGHYCTQYTWNGSSFSSSGTTFYAPTITNYEKATTNNLITTSTSGYIGRYKDSSDHYFYNSTTPIPAIWGRYDYYGFYTKNPSSKWGLLHSGAKPYENGIDVSTPEVVKTSTGTINDIAVAGYLPDKMVVIYNNQPTGTTYGKIVEITDSSLSIGSEQTLWAYQSYTLSIDRKSNTRCIALGANTSGYLTAYLIGISGSTLSNLSSTTVNNVVYGSSYDYANIVHLSGDTSIAVFWDGSGGIKARLISSASDTVSLSGSETTIHSSSYGCMCNAIKLSSTKILVSVVEAIPLATKNHWYIVDISGTTITPGTVYTINGQSSSIVPGLVKHSNGAFLS